MARADDGTADAAVDLDDFDPEDRSRSQGAGVRLAPGGRGRPSRAVAAVIAVGVLLAGAAAASTSARPAAPAAVHEADGRAVGIEASSVLAVLSRPVTEEDALPDGPAFAAPGLRAGTARALGQTPSAQFWAALDGSGRICLVTLVTGASAGYTAECSAPADFATTGEQSTSSVSGVTVDAQLVPDRDDRTGLEAAGYVSAGPNLLVRAAEDTGSAGSGEDAGSGVPATAAPADVPRRGGPTG